jgi:hypothetical protein
MRSVELRMERETFSEKGGEGEMHETSVNEDCPYARYVSLAIWAT